MGINLVVAVTDDDWFEFLRQRTNLTEINFWAPSAAPFRALKPGELFLFKLHAPRNVIVGGGVFAYANTLPCSLAWAAFGEANGAQSAREMRARIAYYRRTDSNEKVGYPRKSTGGTNNQQLGRLAQDSAGCKEGRSIQTIIGRNLYDRADTVC